MSMNLVVRAPFNAWQKGDLVTDVATVEAIMASSQTGFVVPVAVMTALTGTVRISEAGATRFTENGNTRITES